MTCSRWLVRIGFSLLAVSAVAAAQEAPAPTTTTPAVVSPWPGLKPSGAVLLPNGWSLKPAGRQVPVGDFPIALAECPTDAVAAVLHAGYGEHEVHTLDTKTDRVIARFSIPESFGGLVWSADGKRLFVGGGFDDVVYRYDHEGGGLLARRAVLTGLGADVGGRAPVSDDFGLVRSLRGSKPAKGCVAGLALSADGSTLYVANAFAHHLMKLDAESGKLLAEIDLGADSYPYGVLLDEPRDRVYVSLWAGSKVAFLDTKMEKVLGHHATQEHPCEMVAARDGGILFVANANRNTVTVIDTAEGKPIETIGTAIHPDAPAGSTPNSLSLTPDAKLLLVANANTNDVAVINVETPGQSKPLGLIPAGWYPTSVRVSRDGKTVWVANGKGSSSRANRDGPNPLTRSSSIREYIGGLFRGTVSTIALPSPTVLAGYTKTVYECSPINREAPASANLTARPEGSPIPAKVGEKSPIEHCVYIIKENRTYDQVFGDDPRGNGDADLCLFPDKVTPNHHALAREFVLLDNFYVESEVSADGHEWTMAAYATDAVERLWPISYRGDRRAPYPAEGALLPLARPAGGYLFDRAKQAGITYISFGEFVENPPRRGEPATAKLESLEGHIDPLFWSYDLSVPDQERADRFLQVLGEWNEKGEMPRLVVLRLPNDHTSGTRPGAPTPTAMVADNDLALGRVVEGLSKSKFWPKLAIFVVEDDAQNGSDHVDAHRTVALAISPYIKKGSVDSTLYSTSSMLRTMELVLGLEPMSQFDAAARPMWTSFIATATPDLAPYVCRPAGTDLKAVNERTAWGAEKSLKMNLATEDAADDIAFNEIIWKSVKGADSPMPPPVRAAFVRPRLDDEDEDEDADGD
jgi:YVTN family beta-propeller protein